MNEPKVLALWSAPRCMSTAFLRMMVQRGDFQIIHEPFSDLAAQGEYHVAGQRVTTGEDLLGAMLALAADGPVFFKDTTEYRHAGRFAADHRLFEQVEHTFIIRDPRRVVESHYAMNPQVTLPEIGFEYLHEIFELVSQRTGTTPVIVDADELVRRPRDTVAAYCRAVGIPFAEQAMAWESGERTEWSRTSGWHQDVARSTTFQASDSAYETRIDNNATLAEYYRYHLPYYERLRDFALRT